ncbi:hypothetical protein P879_11382 [Paragonimus westermani]|uniref:Uncharacterized protein n=1 Tax=Paragonimus westermani TaxID=34504 RepID=A0A8T0D758_9TREM|nr:hypothetical protein P879_11382 [Paragonimus westermani]
MCSEYTSRTVSAVTRLWNFVPSCESFSWRREPVTS